MASFEPLVLRARVVRLRFVRESDCDALFDWYLRSRPWRDT
jgi:hypothetical protein